MRFEHHMSAKKTEEYKGRIHKGTNQQMFIISMAKGLEGGREERERERERERDRDRDRDRQTETVSETEKGI